MAMRGTATATGKIFHDFVLGLLSGVKMHSFIQILKNMRELTAVKEKKIAAV